MGMTLDEFFFLPIAIGNFISRMFGKKVTGKIAYIVIYLFFTFVSVIVFNNIKEWAIITFIITLVKAYFIAGMVYVLFYKWKDA